MPGTRSDPRRRTILTVFWGYSNAAVTASLYLSELLVTFPSRLGGVACYGTTAGTGAGNTVITLLLNGTSVWRTAGNRPTLAATSTGEFANTMPDDRVLRLGDRLAWQVVSVSTTGHARVFCTAVLEAPE